MTGIVVIGVGNRYRQDDGVGPTTVDMLWGHLPPSVRLCYSLGDTAELIDLWTGADLAVVVDAARSAVPKPGAVHKTVHHTVSSHGLPMGEAIELARALGRLPKRLELYAIEVRDTGHGEGLSPAVLRAAQQTAQTIAVSVGTEVNRRCV